MALAEAMHLCGQRAVDSTAATVDIVNASQFGVRGTRVEDDGSRQALITNDRDAAVLVVDLDSDSVPPLRPSGHLDVMARQRKPVRRAGHGSATVDLVEHSDEFLVADTHLLATPIS